MPVSLKGSELLMKRTDETKLAGSSKLGFRLGF
jgi:hypothetical protein